MDILETLKTRRSINFFEPGKTIPRETLDEILETANLSPSSYNLQPWEVIVVTDPERKKALRALAYNQPKVTESAAMLIMIANPGAVEDILDRVLDRNVELGYLKAEDREKTAAGPRKLYGDRESLTRKLFAVKNTAFFAMSVMTAARAYGLETHPMDGIDTEGIKKEFGIPGDRLVPLLIAIGYPKEGLKLLPRALRRPLAEFVKRDNYR